MDKKIYKIKIQIDGTNTLNKGAELMLYAILKEIEKKHPNSSVIFNGYGHNTIKTSPTQHIKYPVRLQYVQYTRYPRYVFQILKLKSPYIFFSNYRPLNNIDIILDASGFTFGDQWNKSDWHLNIIENYYYHLKRGGTKIILLPQAFGPFETDSGKKSIEILNKYADLIIARETLSQKYLINAGINPEKVCLFPDFTIAVDGIVPEQYINLKNSVCIIPNRKMITRAHITTNKYCDYLIDIIKLLQQKGQNVFLLNHEGKDDLKLCKLINSQLDTKLNIVTGLDAKEIKGVIGNSYLVISSRYHGVASSLNQEAPCLATSWSHKYSLLFQDFDLHNNMIDPNLPFDETAAKIINLLDTTTNNNERLHLRSRKNVLINTTKDMWDKVWTVADNL
jgi:colanic acid/amylovoran biosynthesis protein